MHNRCGGSADAFQVRIDFGSDGGRSGAWDLLLKAMSRYSVGYGGNVHPVEFYLSGANRWSNQILRRHRLYE